MWSLTVGTVALALYITTRVSAWWWLCWKLVFLEPNTQSAIREITRVRLEGSAHRPCSCSSTSGTELINQCFSSCDFGWKKGQIISSSVPAFCFLCVQWGRGGAGVPRVQALLPEGDEGRWWRRGRQCVGGWRHGTQRALEMRGNKDRWEFELCALWWKMFWVFESQLKQHSTVCLCMFSIFSSLVYVDFSEVVSAFVRDGNTHKI